MQLDDRVAIVTGGGMGIGRQVALELAARKAKVIIAEINEEKAVSVATEITDAGNTAVACPTDVTDKQSTVEMAEFAVKRWGRVDILVNNAGADRKGAIWELTEETWDFLMTLNLKGTFLPTQAVVRHMMERKFGRIINMSSMAGKSGEPFTSPYCTTKFGIIGFTQSIAWDLGPFNITANAVCPGAVETDLFKSNVSQSAALNNRTYEEELNEKFLKLTALGRMTQSIDVARVVAFLASDDAESITGTSLNVSAGREMH